MKSALPFEMALRYEPLATITSQLMTDMTASKPMTTQPSTVSDEIIMPK